jgi:DNA-binding NarL/FixJ family response regulator
MDSVYGRNSMEHSMTATRILLADDHRMFRQGLRDMIERKTAFEVVGEAGTGQEALALAVQLHPDIVLLDIQMPNGNGVAVAQQLARTQPEIKIVMLTMYREDQQLVDAIQAGARGYLLKDADAAELISVLERVARGESALDPALTTRVFDAMRRLSTKQQARAQFTEREREILELVAHGHDNRTIALRLHLSEKTVGNRMSEIFQKLGVANRTQAALVARERGLLQQHTATNDHAGLET